MTHHYSPLASLARARIFAAWLGAAALSFIPVQPATAQAEKPFSFDSVRQQARDLSSAEYKAVPEDLPQGTEGLNYDQFRQIRFKPDRALWRGEGINFEMHLLPVGWLYKVPVELLVVADGVAQPIAPDTSLFDLGALAGKIAPEARLSFSGFRLTSPMNRPDVFDEVIVFQGASYFRAVSRGQAYGLSARGLALNVGGASGEEFPFFRKFWIEKPKTGAASVTIYALLDSPSVAGAYRFVVTPGAPTVTDVEVVLYPRTDLNDVGIAPLTSMFLFGPVDRSRISDFREAVHDSDGLEISNGVGEHLWRPLTNPKRLQVSHFEDNGPRGFGLMQRTRRFENYQDLEAAYERRPSAWVEPRGDWGPGAVVLFELPTNEEIHDNIVAFWKPAQPLSKYKEWVGRYTLSWPDTIEHQWSGATVSSTRSGLVNGARRKDGMLQFAVDLSGLRLGSTNELPVAKLEASAGAVGSAIVEANPALPGGIRVSFSFDPKGADLSEFRLQLLVAQKAVSETWLYRWTKN